MKHKPQRLVVMSGLLAVVVAGIAVATLNATPVTQQLHGHLYNIANFGGPDCGSTTGICSSFVATGDIKGDGKVSVDTFPSNDVPSYTTAHTVIRTRKGDLTCTEAALLDLVGPDHTFVDQCIITGGTGIYAGATGYILEVGSFDFVANLGEADYYGKITFADQSRRRND